MSVGNPDHSAEDTFLSRLNNAVIRVYDEAGNVIETHEHKGGFKEWEAQINAVLISSPVLLRIFAALYKFQYE